jgi:hypothetical protein
MKRLHLELALIATIALLATSSPAAAAPAARTANVREEALARWERGKEFFQDGDMAAAVIEFRRAYELFPNYKILYNIAQVCSEQQDHPCALRSFTKYLAEGGSNVAPARVAEVQHEIERLNARVAHLTVTTTPPGAEIAVDDLPAGKTPLAAPIVVSAGRRRITASLRGHLSASKTIEVGGMEQARLSFELTPLTSSAPAVAVVAPGASATGAAGEPRLELKSPSLARRSPGPSSLWWIGPGAGAALATGFAITALAEWKQWDSARKTPSNFPADVDALGSRAHGFAIAADVIGGVTVAAAAVLAGWQLWARHHGGATTHAALRLDVAANGLVGGRF